MSWYDPLRSAAWNAVLRVSGSTLTELSALRRWQWLPPEQSAALQASRLRRLLESAARQVPYWRDTLQRAGVIDAAGRADPTGLSSIPLLDKHTLRNETDSLIASPPRRGGYWNTSGGSTGEPVRFRQDAPFRDAARSAAMLCNDWAGYTFGQTMVKVWGSERDLFDGGEAWRTSAVRWLRGEVWLNAFRMTPQQMRDYATRIEKLRPRMVLGYVESVYDLARFAEREGVSLGRPYSVMTSAGPLEAPVRETIARAFGAPVFNRYGSREVGDLACDCEVHAGLHVLEPHHVVEILRHDGTPAPPGEVGEIVVTLLTNFTMPLIRFRIGDTAAWATGSCPCGRSWARLANVAGRVSDMFVRLDGTRIHGEYFTHLFYFLDWVQKFQVVQMSPDHVVVRIVPRAGEREPALAHAETLADVVAKIRLVMGEACRVDMEYPESIDPSASGKFRYTISHVLQ